MDFCGLTHGGNGYGYISIGNKIRCGIGKSSNHDFERF